MTEKPPPPEEIEQHRRYMWLLLKKQVRLLDYAIAALVTDGAIADKETLVADQDVIHTIVLMAQGMGVSAHSILKLTEAIDMSIRDCLSISRSVVEIGINIAYIVAGGQPIVQLAQRHAMQKGYRDLERAGTIGSMEFRIIMSGRLPDPKTVPGLDEALKEFSTSKGKEIRDWTKDNINQRLEVVEKKFRSAYLNLFAAHLLVYRHSSEIMHGTYFSVRHYWTGGTGRNPKDKNEFEWLFLNTHFMSAINATFLVINAVVEILVERYKIQKLDKYNKEYWEFFKQYIELREAEMDTKGEAG